MLSSNIFIRWVYLIRERALKIKEVPKEILEYLGNDSNLSSFKSVITCDLPNKQIYSFNGKVKIGQRKEVYLSTKQLLWRGATLSTTRWAIGVIVYAGMETKIMLNQGFI